MDWDVCSERPCCCLPVGRLRGKETGKCRARDSELLELMLIDVVLLDD